MQRSGRRQDLRRPVEEFPGDLCLQGGARLRSLRENRRRSWLAMFDNRFIGEGTRRQEQKNARFPHQNSANPPPESYHGARRCPPAAKYRKFG